MYFEEFKDPKAITMQAFKSCGKVTHKYNDIMQNEG